MANKHCPYCGVVMVKSGRDAWPTRDHIIALSRGGSNTVDNIIIICRRCNEDKGSLLPDEFIAWREGRASRLDKGTRGNYQMTQYQSTLARGDEIERDFFELKSQEFGPAATRSEIEACVRAAIDNLWHEKIGE